MYSNKLYTPLRYPGGKARFAPLIASMMRDSDLDGGHYLEPYAGGAGVALHLLFEEVVKKIHINDADPAIATFWRVATQDAEKLIGMVATEPITMDAWYHWRGVMLGTNLGTDLERGFATLFMNRTNRSGILKGGVIGGKEQAGAYKVDARFMRDELCLRLERIKRYAKRIKVYEQDAYELLVNCHHFLPTRSLIYLDPPYYIKGAGLYRNFYKHDDHLRIAELLGGSRFRRPWVVSYDNVTEIRSMYSYAHSLTYGLNYTAQRRYEGSEVMFISNKIKLPDELHVGFERETVSG